MPEEEEEDEGEEEEEEGGGGEEEEEEVKLKIQCLRILLFLRHVKSSQIFLLIGMNLYI